MASPGDWWYMPVVTTSSANVFTYNAGATYGYNTGYPQSSGPQPFPQQHQMQFTPQFTPTPAPQQEERYPEIAHLRRRIEEVTQLVAA